MQKYIITLISLFFTAPCLVLAEEQLITDAGREVIINDDGSWSFASEDRYATNTDGERIRLKPNGSWEILSVDENLSTAHSAVYRNAPGYESAEFAFDRVVIESVRTKATVSSKNVHQRNQTVFYVQVSVPENETQALEFETSRNIFSVEDSGGRAYTLLRVTPAIVNIEPGFTETIEVRVDGAPGWKFGKSYELTISADILASNQDVVLSIPLSETRKIELEEFPR